MADDRTVIAVFGATGFVGSAVMRSLAGVADVHAFTSPRLAWTQGTPLPETLPSVDVSVIERLADELIDVDVVINCAGDPNASSMNLDELLAANALMPLHLLRACERAGVHRFIQVSSAVVQGDLAILDSSCYVRPFSPYSHSKAFAEQWLLVARAENADLVIYRPPSVHAPGRGVTRKVASIARSPWRSVSGDGSGPSPQALLSNVADAIAFLALSPENPPEIVHHPWEGVTCVSLMETLGGREPHHLPHGFAHSVLRIARRCESVIPQLAPYRRRTEMMWLGQQVAPSWLTEAGWVPHAAGRNVWNQLGQVTRNGRLGRQS